MPKPTIEQLRERFPHIPAASDEALQSPFFHLGVLQTALDSNSPRDRISLDVIEEALMEWARTSRFLVLSGSGEVVIRANTSEEAHRYANVMPNGRVIDVLTPMVEVPA